MTNTKENHSEKFLGGESILQGMPEIAYIFDKEGRMVRWNKNVELILGYSKDELYHKFVAEFIDEPDRQKVLNEFKSVFTDGKERTVEYNMLLKSGEKIPYHGSGSLAIVKPKQTTQAFPTSDIDVSINRCWFRINDLILKSLMIPFPVVMIHVISNSSLQ